MILKTYLKSGHGDNNRFIIICCESLLVFKEIDSTAINLTERRSCNNVSCYT